MYAIISEGTEVWRTDKPAYITLESPNGTPQETKKAEDADCVSVHGKLYQLPGAKHINEDLPSAIIRKVDSGAVTYKTGQEAQKTEHKLDETTAEIEAAICQIDMLYSDMIAELEMTLCEMDMEMNAQEDV